MGADDPAAALARIRERYERATSGTRSNLPADTPRLLAAVEAVLKEADRLSRKTVKGSPLERIRGECAEVIREAVRAALTGEEAGDGT